MSGGAYRRELEAAVRAARAAGALLLEEFQRDGGPRGSPGKCPADAHAEALIHEHLGTAFRDYGFCGEELPGPRRAARDRQRHNWIIDPNDGTACFQRGRRDTAVSIALLRGDLPVLGVVYSSSARAGRGDLLAWAEGGPLSRDGRPLAAWPAGGQHSVALLSASTNRMGEYYVPLCAPSRYRALPSIAYRLALAAVEAGAAAVSTHNAIRELDVAGSSALLRGARRLLLTVAPKPETLRFSGDGLRRVGRCAGGAADLTRRLASLNWGFPAPPQPARPYDLLRSLPGRVCAATGLLERAQGCLLGCCLGDNFAAWAKTPGAALTRRLRQADPCLLEEQAKPPLLAGQPAAAGEAALLAARVITAEEGYAPGQAAATLAWWRKSGPPPAAGAPRGAIPTALARAVPLGIYGHALETGALIKLARADAALDRLSPAQADAGAAYCMALAAAVREGPEDGAALHAQVLSRACAGRLCPEVLEALEAAAPAARGPAPAAGPHAAPAVRALHHVFRQLLRAEEPAAGLLRAATEAAHPMHAALTGALLGAVHGAPAWPDPWIGCLLSCRPLAGAPGCRRPRPRACWPVDCLELAERLAWLGYGAPA